MPALTLPRIDPACYDAALTLVQVIDHHLKRGSQHYYIKGNKEPLRTLDQVVNAILDGELVIDAPQPEAAT